MLCLKLLIGQQERHPACKNWVVRCWHGCLSGARCKWFAYGPADATATPSSLAPVKSRMVYLSGAGLPKRNGCSSTSNCSRMEPLGTKWHWFLRAGCPSCHSTNSVKEFKALNTIYENSLIEIILSSPPLNSRGRYVTLPYAGSKTEVKGCISDFGEMVIINPQKCRYIFPRGCPCTNTHTQLFMALFPGQSRSAGARRDLLPDFVVQGKITEADTPTIRLGATPSGLISDPPPTSPHLYAGCPSRINPPNLSWIGIGTKYVGLHTQWHGLPCTNYPENWPKLSLCYYECTKLGNNWFAP